MTKHTPPPEKPATETPDEDAALPPPSDRVSDQTLGTVAGGASSFFDEADALFGKRSGKRHLTEIVRDGE